MSYAIETLDTSDDRSLRMLRRHARYLTGDTGQGNEIAQMTMRVMSGSPPRENAREPRNIRLLRALHQLHPELSETDSTHARCTQALAVIEHCTKLQISDILALEPGDTLPRSILSKYQSLPVGRSIFLIEDEALLAMDVCQAITDYGNTIAGIARTSAEAIQRVGRINPDVIVSDVTLADGSSGVEAVAKIAATNQHLPVVFLTGTPEIVLTANDDDPVYILEKPHDPEQLQLMMALALRGSEELPLAVGARAGEQPDQESDDRKNHDE